MLSGEEKNEEVSPIWSKIKKHKVWFYVFLGILLGACLPPFALKCWSLFNFAYFDRSGLDELTSKYIGDIKWD